MSWEPIAATNGDGWGAQTGNAEWQPDASAPFKPDESSATATNDVNWGSAGAEDAAAINGVMNGVTNGDNEACRNCGEAGHFARECPQPRQLKGDCFNCGEVGHNKADCPNPRVERAYDGACRICGKEGHRAVDCKTRTLKYEGVEDMNEDTAWTAMKAADKEKDVDRFRKMFMAYAKAVSALDGGAETFKLAELEQTFRDEGWNAHLVAKEAEVALDYTIVDFQGNIDKSYILDMQWAATSRRPAFREKLAQSAAENLERLQDCGLIVDREVPRCGQCGELGHVRKHCKEDAPAPRETPKCSNCETTEHKLRDCPNERVDKRLSCRNCGQPGHKAADCTEPRSAENVECRRCGEMGHFSKDCPNNQGPSGCRNCGQEGHIAKECTEPRNPATVQCRNCDEMGHFSKECPKPRDYSRVQCNTCQQMGHTSVRCSAKADGAETAAADGDAGGGWGVVNGDDDAGAPASNDWEKNKDTGNGGEGDWASAPAQAAVSAW